MRYKHFLLVLVSQVFAIQYNHFRYGYKQFESFRVKVIPHPDKIAKGGEDSYYVNAQILSVADGVGGWNLKGVDPAKYSRELASNIELIFRQDYIKQPKKLLTEASILTKNIGSSTLVILTMDQTQDIIHSSYIGDSGYLIMRIDPKNSSQLILVYESEEQQHSFNYPYQLGNPGDNPIHAHELTHTVQDGDILVIGSDGLFDNLDTDMIIEILEAQLQVNEKIKHEEDAKILGKMAFKQSLDKTFNSPFAKKAKQQGKRYMGGKSDDITVIVATVNFVQWQNEDI